MSSVGSNKLYPVLASTPLNAAFHVAGAGIDWTVTFDSRGGEKNVDGLERNSDYYSGIDVVLGRLAGLGATLESAYIASSSRVVQALALDEQKLEITVPYPVDLANYDLRRLRLDLCGAQTAQRFREPGAKGGGNGTKKFEIRVRLREPLAVDSDLVPSLVGGFGDSPPQDVYDFPGTKSSRNSNGAGYVVDVERKVAIELAAMEAAWRHYEQDWDLEDVSAQRGLGYDIHAEKDGRRRFIEVKGTTSLGLSVGVTAKEVETAQREGISELFILWGIRFDEHGTPTGTTRIISPWVPESSRLIPRAFDYLVPHDSSSSAT